ncbi:hypothetical protein ACRBEV_17715 [Methylobacterium phyllosphaerae]
MPYGARTSLAALILVLGLGGASAEPAATTWTDPPAHKPAAETAPAADRKAVAPVPAVSTPAAASSDIKTTSARRKAVAARPARERTVARSRSPVAKRIAATPRRARVAATRVRTIRRAPQVAAAAPPPPPTEGYARYRAYGYGPGYGEAPGYADDRLDRLSSAQAAGYLVVHRRTVQFPDGRTLRVYRPDDGGEPF